MSTPLGYVQTVLNQTDSHVLINCNIHEERKELISALDGEAALHFANRGRMDRSTLQPSRWLYCVYNLVCKSKKNNDFIIKLQVARNNTHRIIQKYSDCREVLVKKVHFIIVVFRSVCQRRDLTQSQTWRDDANTSRYVRLKPARAQFADQEGNPFSQSELTLPGQAHTVLWPLHEAF